MKPTKKKLSKKERKQQARDEYWRKRQSLRDEYERKEQPLWDERSRKLAEIDAEADE